MFIHAYNYALYIYTHTLNVCMCVVHAEYLEPGREIQIQIHTHRYTDMFHIYGMYV